MDLQAELEEALTKRNAAVRASSGLAGCNSPRESGPGQIRSYCSSYCSGANLVPYWKWS